MRELPTESMFVDPLCSTRTEKGSIGGLEALRKGLVCSDATREVANVFDSWRVTWLQHFGEQVSMYLKM